MRLIDDICSSSNDNVLASFDRDDDDDDARRMGTNASKLSNCRTKLNTLGAGGPSVAYTPRSYIECPIQQGYKDENSIARPCDDLSSFVGNDDLLSFN